MPTENCTLNLLFKSSFCNDWPIIEIYGNGKLLWKDRIIKEADIYLEFPRLDTNQIEIQYNNKRSGPDVWDTKVDNDGNIIEDQYCTINGIKIDSSDCKWLINEFEWETKNEKIKSYGFMNFNGKTKIEFPAKTYQWISISRYHWENNHLFNRDQNSSVDFKGIYNPAALNDPTIQQLLKEAKKHLHEIEN